eukprot:5304463-Amphidinium_carterae.1
MEKARSALQELRARCSSTIELSCRLMPANSYAAIGSWPQGEKVSMYCIIGSPRLCGAVDADI